MNVKNCPICGSTPYLDVEPLWSEHGGGYPGCFSYTYKCPHCEMIKANSSDTVYTKNKAECNERAAQYWNEAVGRVEKFLKEKETR